ncbi:hypothetical protein CHUAL_007672 [Chamberlinius hualienensis]
MTKVSKVKLIVCLFAVGLVFDSIEANKRTKFGFGKWTKEKQTKKGDNQDVFQGCEISYDINPLCGTDGNTYINLSELRCIEKAKPGLTVKHRGQCKH